MDVTFSLSAVILSLIVGSFLNVVILRLEKGEGFVGGRSYCVHCRKTLRWIDLIPVVSFLLLAGRCRYCKKRISLQYPLVEIATGILFFLIFQKLFAVNIFEMLALWYIAGSLVVIFVYDLRNYIIPDKVLFPAIVVAFLYQAVFHGDYFIHNVIFAAIVATGFFLAIFLVSKGKWMGFGDVKLAVLLGLILGFPNILAGLFLAFASGAVAGVFSILLKGKGLKSEMPFAPFLIFGTMIAYFWGPQLIQWYVKLLLF